MKQSQMFHRKNRCQNLKSICEIHKVRMIPPLRLLQDDQQLQEETPTKPAKNVASHLTIIPHSANRLHRAQNIRFPADLDFQQVNDHRLSHHLGMDIEPLGSLHTLRNWL